MPYSVGLHKSLIESSFFAPRGHSRIYNLGMQIAQLQAVFKLLLQRPVELRFLFIDLALRPSVF